MILSNAWTNFWNDFVGAIQNAWNDVTNFWIGSETQTPYIANFLCAIVVLILGIAVIKLFIRILNKTLKLDKKVIKERSVKVFIVSTIKIVLYFALVIVILAILRVELSGVTQIFSSAILAIGLSLQDVISNFASGIIILTSKPFVTGDYIKVEDQSVEGSVVDVRFLVTTIETVNKQIVTIPNKTITSSVLTNYTRNPLWRIVVNIGVDYSTDIDKAKKVLVDIANSEDRILENPKPVCYVTAFEASDINLSLRCYVPNVLYWDVFFALNEKVLIEFNKQNIQIPYNRLVVQTLDEDGKVNVKKGVKQEWKFVKPINQQFLLI